MNVVIQGSFSHRGGVSTLTGGNIRSRTVVTVVGKKHFECCFFPSYSLPVAPGQKLFNIVFLELPFNIEFYTRSTWRFRIGRL